MSTNVSVSHRVLADAVPGGLIRDIGLVGLSTGFVALSAQASIPLPFTPIPLSLQTFAVLLSAAALGPVRAATGMLLYLLVGAAGVPWFANDQSGWSFPSFGYIVGFVLAAALVGALARRGADRTVPRTAALMALGNLVIYVVGVAGLMWSTGAGLGKALAGGVAPFLIGDAVKILLAAGSLPGAWKIVKRLES